METLKNNQTIKIVESPFRPNGQPCPALTDFDKYYIDNEVHDVVKKTGDGEEDFIVIKKLVLKKRDIKEVINASASEVGVENMINRLARSGESLPNVVVGEDVIDTTRMPSNLAEAIQFGEEARKKFEALPKELVNGRSYEEFIKTCSASEVLAYYQEKEKANKPNDEAKPEGGSN